MLGLYGGYIGIMDKKNGNCYTKHELPAAFLWLYLLALGGNYYSAVGHSGLQVRPT